MTSDPNAAASFYTDLVGWGTKQWEGGDQPYTMWTSGGQPLGGVMDIPPEARAAGAPPNWMAYVAVPDVGAAAERAKELGGQVLKGPMEVPGGDQIAQCMDPQGAMFALHSSPR
jgi:predicted enzyme related to lactoylglutathione lyase